MNSEPYNIAVIGSGVAGLTVTHILQRKHHVTLFEKDGRLGGHTNTVIVPEGPDAGTPVDTGFIVMNHRNYPLLTRLFEQLGVELRDSDMSFGYYDMPSGLQYSGSGLNGLFAQRVNLLRPSFHRMVRDVLRFFKTARQTLDENSLIDETLGGYLQHHGFSNEFIEHHLIPMGSAIWSTPCDSMLQFPALSFLQFFRNHGLLTVNDRPQWRTVLGGSSTYVARMRQQWSQVTTRLNVDIAGIERTSSGATLRFRDGNTEPFDHVVLAVHADQALPMLQDTDPTEQELLGCWRYTNSRTVLHTDTSVMPPLKRVWSSWNFRRIEGSRTSLTYDMNRLQGLKTTRPLFVSLNPEHEPTGIIREFSYDHPMFTREALLQRPKLASLNGRRNTWFAGSYFGNGFHEDAVRSAVAVAKNFDVEL